MADGDAGFAGVGEHQGHSRIVVVPECLQRVSLGDDLCELPVEDAVAALDRSSATKWRECI